MDYFGELDEGAVKDNFSTVYQLLEVHADLSMIYICILIYKRVIYPICLLGNDGQWLPVNY